MRYEGYYNNNEESIVLAKARTSLKFNVWKGIIGRS